MLLALAGLGPTPAPRDPMGTIRRRDRKILGTREAAGVAEEASAASFDMGKASHIQGAVAVLALASRHSRETVAVLAGRRAPVAELAGRWGIVRGLEAAAVRRRRDDRANLTRHWPRAGLEELAAPRWAVAGQAGERPAPHPALHSRSLDQSPIQVGGCR